jgi:hypothetical protein
MAIHHPALSPAQAARPALLMTEPEHGLFVSLGANACPGLFNRQERFSSRIAVTDLAEHTPRAT